MRLAHVATVDLSLRFLLRDQLRAFREAGFELVAISAPGPWVRDIEHDGIVHIPVASLRRSWDPLADWRAFSQLIKVFRKVRPDIVHTHTPKAGVLGRIAARIAGVPTIVNTAHGLYARDDRKGGRRRLFLLLERIAARCSNFEFCQSAEDLDMLRRLRIVDPFRSAFLGNGVNLREFNPLRVDRNDSRARLSIPPDAVVLGTVGRLVWEKGYREFFAMASALKKIVPNVIAMAVGPMEPGKRDAIPAEIINDVQQRGIARFLGMRTDMPDLYAAMDVFVLPSYREGFPRSAVEAAAMGLPLVLSDIRGCREVVTDNWNGFLVPPRDAPRLTDRVSQLLSNRPLRERFGRMSRERALQEFDERRVVAITLDVYRQLVEERTHGSRLATHQNSATRG